MTEKKAKDALNQLIRHKTCWDYEGIERLKAMYNADRCGSWEKALYGFIKEVYFVEEV